MNEEDVVIYIYAHTHTHIYPKIYTILLIYHNMGRLRDNFAKWNKSDREIKILCDITHIETQKCSIKYNKKEADSQI